LKRARIKQIDAFTSVPFGGNPAQVLTEAARLSEDEMKKIAGESGFETAFVQKASQNKSPFKIRFFAPMGELKFAGHLTIAAFHALSEEAKFFLSEPLTKMTQETKAGHLNVEIHSARGQIQKIMIELPKPAFLEKADPEEIARVLEIESDEMDKTPPQVVEVGSAHLMVPVKNRRIIENLKPDLYALSEINQRMGAVSTHVFAPDAVSPIAMVHGRNFAPAIGIHESAASGAANGALGAFLINSRMIRGNSPITFIAEQGHSLGRPCEINVEVHFKETDVTLVRIGGQAVTIMEGEVFL